MGNLMVISETTPPPTRISHPRTAQATTTGTPALAQVASQQKTAARSGVWAAEMAGHADLVAAAGAEHLLIEPGPVLDRINAAGL